MLAAADVSLSRHRGELPIHIGNATHEAFMNGNYRMMVATKAFGMDIDKAQPRLAQVMMEVVMRFRNRGPSPVSVSWLALAKAGPSAARGRSVVELAEG